MSGCRSPATHSFSLLDWGMVGAVALMWGSSFLLIRLGVEDLHPTVVGWLRLLFGAAALACVPAARAPLRRADRPLVALLGIVWMAAPFVLFPLAELSIPSALAGMINGAAPLFTAAIAAGWSRRLPARTPIIGLAVGFAGVLMINLPAARGSSASAVGIGFVLLATVLYGVAFNLAGPLQARSGGLPVIWRAQLVALAVDTPAGVFGMAGSSPSSESLVAMLALGVLSTGLAFAIFTALIGRVGPTRASVTVYLVPIVAIGLGVAVVGEAIHPISIAGIAVVLLGAYLTGR